MSKSPLIVLPADVKDVDLYRWHAAAETYCRAVIAGFGGTPLVLPSLAGVDVDAVLDRIDGVLLTGSRSNVHPARYGEAADPRSEPYDTGRDATAFALIERAIARGVPLFAICRGMQELNVALGGTLQSEIQELPGRDDVGALRLRLVATKDRPCADFPGTDADGKHDPAVILDLDYWALMPR